MTAPEAWTPDLRRALFSKQDVSESKLIARVMYGGDVIPGWANHRGECHVAWGGQGVVVIAPRRVQFLQESEHLGWVTWNGSIPRNAVLAGRTSYGENTYIARYEIGHEKIPGRLQPSYDCLLLSNNGREYVVKDGFEVLISRVRLRFDE